MEKPQPVISYFKTSEAPQKLEFDISWNLWIPSEHLRLPLWNFAPYFQICRVLARNHYEINYIFKVKFQPILIRNRWYMADYCIEKATKILKEGTSRKMFLVKRMRRSCGNAPGVLAVEKLAPLWSGFPDGFSNIVLPFSKSVINCSNQLNDWVVCLDVKGR